MTSNKEIARRALMMWTQGSEVDTSFFAPDYKNHQQPIVGGGEGTIDLKTWAGIVEANHTAFPDLKVEFLTQLADGDRVSTYWRFSGTQTGEYLGKPASGRRAMWSGVQIDRFAEGLIAESWVVWDFHTQLVQLGLVDELSLSS